MTNDYLNGKKITSYFEDDSSDWLLHYVTGGKMLLKLNSRTPVISFKSFL